MVLLVSTKMNMAILSNFLPPSSNECCVRYLKTCYLKFLIKHLLLLYTTRRESNLIVKHMQEDLTLDNICTLNYIFKFYGNYLNV